MSQELTDLGLRGHVLKSSAVKPVRAPGAEFPEGLDWALERRAKGAGARKGRTLGIWQGDQPVAACAWHLPPTGPLVIFDLGWHSDLPEEVALLCAVVLMGCLRAIAGHRNIKRGTACVRWTDRPFKDYEPKADRNRVRGDIRKRATDLGFTKLRNPPQELKGAWATELCF